MDLARELDLFVRIFACVQVSLFDFFNAFAKLLEFERALDELLAQSCHEFRFVADNEVFVRFEVVVPAVAHEVLLLLLKRALSYLTFLIVTDVFVEPFGKFELGDLRLTWFAHSLCSNHFELYIFQRGRRPLGLRSLCESIAGWFLLGSLRFGDFLNAFLVDLVTNNLPTDCCSDFTLCKAGVLIQQGAWCLLRQRDQQLNYPLVVVGGFHVFCSVLFQGRYSFRMLNNSRRFILMLQILSIRLMVLAKSQLVLQPKLLV